MEKNARGIRLIDERKKPTSTIYLFKLNSAKYLVSIHYTFLGILFAKKNYEFRDEILAISFYNKVSYKHQYKSAFNAQ